MLFSRKNMKIVREKGLYEFFKNPDLGTLSIINFIIGIVFFALVGEHLLSGFIVYEMGLDGIIPYILGSCGFAVVFLIALKSKRRDNEERLEHLQNTLDRIEKRHGDLAAIFKTIQNDMASSITYNLKGRGLGMLTANWLVSFSPIPFAEKITDIAAMVYGEGHSTHFITDDGIVYHRNIGNSIGDYRFISGLLQEANPFMLTKDNEVTLKDGSVTTVKELFDNKDYDAIVKEFKNKKAE